VGILSRPEDRRVSRRRSLAQLPDVTAVKVASQEVDVINASNGGILIECSLRLPPGTESRLEILRSDAALRVSGRVLRCQVMEISPDGLRYQIAIAFSKPIDIGGKDDVSGATEPDLGAADLNSEGLNTEGLNTAAPPQEEPAGSLDQPIALELDEAFVLNSW